MKPLENSQRLALARKNLDLAIDNIKNVSETVRGYMENTSRLRLELGLGLGLVVGYNVID